MLRVGQNTNVLGYVIYLTSNHTPPRAEPYRIAATIFLIHLLNLA